jgi:integrase
MFSIELLVDEFLEQKSYAYFNHIKAFMSFIESKEVKNENLKVYLQGIRTEDIVESLDYYIKQNQVTSIDTAQRYSSAIKEFLVFLFNRDTLNNKELLDELYFPTFMEESFRYKMNQYILNSEVLKEREGFKIFSNEEVKELLDQCNEILDSEEGFTKAKNSKKYFNKYRSALILKLILLTGVTYKVICKLISSDLNLTMNTIKINGYEIHLPHLMRNQFYKFIKLKDVLHIKENYLFVEFNGDPLSNTTSTTSQFMQSILSRGDLNGLIKYAIVGMIKNGINETIIKEVTGVRETIYSECHSIAFEKKEAVRHFDSKIRGLEIFDSL